MLTLTLTQIILTLTLTQIMLTLTLTQIMLKREYHELWRSADDCISYSRVGYNCNNNNYYCKINRLILLSLRSLYVHCTVQPVLFSLLQCLYIKQVSNSTQFEYFWQPHIVIFKLLQTIFIRINNYWFFPQWGVSPPYPDMLQYCTMTLRIPCIAVRATGIEPGVGICELFRFCEDIREKRVSA